MIPPPGGGSPFNQIDPSGPNQSLAAVQEAWSQWDQFINNGLASGWNDLQIVRAQGDGLFFPHANL
jgi:hypothetical protein